MKITKGIPFLNRYVEYGNLNYFEQILLKFNRKEAGFNQRMFDEDFSRIFRYGNKQEGNLFNVESNDELLTKKIFENAHARYKQRLIDNTTRKLVEDIAQSLVCYGKAYYFAHHVIEEDKINIFPLNQNNLFRFLGIHFQFLPRRCERNFDRDDKTFPRELRFLDKNKLMQFNIPNTLERILSDQKKILASIDKHALDSTIFFPKVTHENPHPENYFNFQVWTDQREQVLFRATSKSGWNGRNSNPSKRSDFFNCYRLIRFRRNQLTLRDHILLQLSEELTKIGRQYNPHFNITVSPSDILPQISRLNDLEDLLSREEISFTEVMDYCYDL